jgi:hypothetical protein
MTTNRFLNLLTIAIVLLVAWAIFSQAGIVHADSRPVNPFYSICADPLFTGGPVLMLDCGEGSPARKDRKPADAIPTTETITETITTVETVITETVTDESPADVLGNPGNDKAVGHAGEKCDKGMCENTDGETGEHGRSNND